MKHSARPLPSPIRLPEVNIMVQGDLFNGTTYDEQRRLDTIVADVEHAFGVALEREKGEVIHVNVVFLGTIAQADCLVCKDNKEHMILLGRTSSKHPIRQFVSRLRKSVSKL